MNTHVHALRLGLGAHNNTRSLEFTLLLQYSKSASLLELTFASLALRLLALRVSQASASLGQHLLLYE